MINALYLTIAGLLVYAIVKRKLVLPFCGIFFIVFIISVIKPHNRNAITESPTVVALATVTPEPTATPKLTDEDIRKQNNATLASSKSRSSVGATSNSSPPLKSRIVKHQPDGFVDSDKADIVAVKKAVKAIHWSLNSDPRAAAKEDFQSIVNYCAKNESRHLLADLTSEAEYNDYIVGNEAANSAYRDGFTEAQAAGFKQALEEQAAAAGPPPEATAWGVSPFVHDAIKELLNDPDSYKYISKNGAWPMSHNGKDCWLEKVHFHARNGFNAVITQTASVWIKTTNGHEDVLDVQMTGE